MPFFRPLTPAQETAILKELDRMGWRVERRERTWWVICPADILREVGGEQLIERFFDSGLRDLRRVRQFANEVNEQDPAERKRLIGEHGFVTPVKLRIPDI